MVCDRYESFMLIMPCILLHWKLSAGDEAGKEEEEDSRHSWFAGGCFVSRGEGAWSAQHAHRVGVKREGEELPNYWISCQW